jgi:hypothetical protein
MVIPTIEPVRQSGTRDNLLGGPPLVFGYHWYSPFGPHGQWAVWFTEFIPPVHLHTQQFTLIQECLAAIRKSSKDDIPFHSPHFSAHSPKLCSAPYTHSNFISLSLFLIALSFKNLSLWHFNPQNAKLVF